MVLTNKITPTTKQAAAIKIIVNRIKSGEKISVLQGVAGSGKSTVQNIILEELGYADHEIIYLAFTGAAVQVLKRKNLPAQTLHKFLFNTIPRPGGGVMFKPKHPETYKNLKLIVVDEFSMLTEDFLDILLVFGIQVLLVGDSFQLPPIGRQNRLVKYYDAYLDEPLRQALDNPVLWAANKIRTGEQVKYDNYGNILIVGSEQQMHENWYNKQMQFVCKFNETKDVINLKIAKSDKLSIGDKIIFNSNDWDKDITNGTMALINDFKNRGIIYYLTGITDSGIKFKNYFATYKTQKFKKQTFDLGYAITVHKSQGSTFDMPGVFFDESTTFSPHARRFMYTALTRFTGNFPVYWCRKQEW